MPTTHISLYYHLIFSTKNRHRWIKGCWENRLYSYTGGIIRGLNGVAEEIRGTEDHVHILASLKATHCLADILREIKSCSSAWVHDVIGNRLFAWQEGYGAFSVSSWDVDAIRRYIQGQKEHHYRKTYQEEYVDLLKRSGIKFDERYLW